MISTLNLLSLFSSADFPAEYRRLQGLLPRRFTEIRLGPHGGAEEAIPNPLSDAPRRNVLLLSEKELKNLYFLNLNSAFLNWRRHRREWKLKKCYQRFVFEIKTRGMRRIFEIFKICCSISCLDGGASSVPMATFCLRNRRALEGLKIIFR